MINLTFSLVLDGSIFYNVWGENGNKSGVQIRQSVGMQHNEVSRLDKNTHITLRECISEPFLLKEQP